MTYKLETLDRYNNKSHSFRGSGYMPIPCGSLVNSWCPLKKNQTITYSAPFRLVATKSLRNWFEDRIPLYLTIEMTGRNGSGIPLKVPMFRFGLIINLKYRFFNIN